MPPLLEQLATLAAIILLRAALNFFIEREINSEQNTRESPYTSSATK